MEEKKSNQPVAGIPVHAGSILPRQRLMDIVSLRYVSQAVIVAARKGIANVVKSQGVPVHVSEIAKQLECHEINLYRLMSYLACYGVFEEKEGQFFVGNELSDAMREDSPDNCYRRTLALGMEAFSQAVVNMESALDKSTEKTPFELANGEPFYQYLSHSPEHQFNFDKGVQSQTLAWQSKIPDHYDFSRYGTIVDLAGGSGGLLKSIMLKCPNIEGKIFETPSVIKNLPSEMFGGELKNRFHAICGDFFDKIDAVADLFTIAMTLHCFEDGRLKIILSNIAKAMRQKSGSRLLIIELDYDNFVKPNEPGFVKSTDMMMMLVMGGRERDLCTWKTILDGQGLKILQKVRFPPSFMGLECELA